MYAAEFRQTMRSAKFRTEPVLQQAAPPPTSWPPALHKRLPMPIWAADIVYEAAVQHGVTAEDVMSASRRVPIVDARAEAMYRIYAMRAMWPALSTTKIGVWFNRDYTSVAHLISRHAEDYGLPNLAGNYAKNRKRALVSYRRTQGAGK